MSYLCNYKQTKAEIETNALDVDSLLPQGGGIQQSALKRKNWKSRKASINKRLLSGAQSM